VTPLLSSLFEFLFKHPIRVFEKGTLVWQAQGSAGALVLIVALAGAVAAVTYARAKERSRPLDRLVLLTLRLAILGVLLACLLQPALVLSTSVPQRNALALVFDDSRSMSIRDLDSLARIDVVRRAFGDSSGTLLRRLSDRFVLRSYHNVDVCVPGNDTAVVPHRTER
jgi:hypothetical protein